LEGWAEWAEVAEAAVAAAVLGAIEAGLEVEEV
jgi:hypothetical protein